MPRRSYEPVQEEIYSLFSLPKLPLEYPLIVYARQSAKDAPIRNKESYDMQTVRLVAYGRELGWTGEDGILVKIENKRKDGKWRSANGTLRRACIMAEQHTLEVGNAIIVLTGMNAPFRDGHTTGYLEFYDERHRPSFPLTSQVISDYLTMIVNGPSIPPLWKAGRLIGWIEALIENDPHTFRSFPLEERITTLQEA